MPDRICETPGCNARITPRRGTPAKHCEPHRSYGSCGHCGAVTTRQPGVTRGPLPKFCNDACRHQAWRASRTPEQLAEHRRRSRESCRFDIFCLDCGDLIPRREDGMRRDLRCETCRPAHEAKRSARKNREKKFRQYGITPDRYDGMLAAQGGGCAFCGTERAHPTLDHEFYVDHDHSCCPGKGRSCGECVRFLLCHQCNVGVGNFRDDPALLRAAADALELYQLTKEITHA